MLLSAIPYVLGYLLMVVPSVLKQQDERHIIYQLCIGRTLCGVGVGMHSSVVNVYLVEISAAKYRGFLGGYLPFSIGVGITFAYLLGVGVKPYYWLANAALFMVALGVLFVLFLPETPRWLLMNRQTIRAYATLRYLRGPEADVSNEMKEIELSLENEESTLHWSMFKQHSVWKPAVTSFAILFFQQAVGTSAVISYASIIVNSTHPSKNLLVYEPSILTAVGLVVTILVFILVDRWGRRVLLLSSSAFVTLSLTGFAVFYKINSNMDVNNISDYCSPRASWLALASLLTFTASFSLGWGPIVFLVVSEIVPTRARATVSGIGTTVNGTTAFLVTYLFHDFNMAISYYGTFLLYAAFGLASLIFVALFLPETRGQTLEDIEQYFSGVRVFQGSINS
jgi:SP family facilitated glucose transporter-like MFS transporter 8